MAWDVLAAAAEEKAWIVHAGAAEPRAESSLLEMRSIGLSLSPALLLSESFLYLLSTLHRLAPSLQPSEAGRCPDRSGVEFSWSSARADTRTAVATRRRNLFPRSPNPTHPNHPLNPANMSFSIASAAPRPLWSHATRRMTLDERLSPSPPTNTKQCSVDLALCARRLARCFAAVQSSHAFAFLH